ncbi:hypothetical protein M3Y97_00135500 [Aphelenchoides bicaudatus]|nr:hypothetical protein M3Y97_00135500 [Aphelenchoides bicaudatus]
MACRLILFVVAVGIFVSKPAISQTQTQQPPQQTAQQQQSYSAPLTCFQQFTVPSGINNISFPNSNQNQYQQPAQTQLSNMTLPSITCSTSANACFKFVCAGTANYTVKGCQDPTQTQFSCTTLQNQCPGTNGQCYTCNGNNCNAGPKIDASSLLALLGTAGSMLAAFYLA